MYACVKICEVYADIQRKMEVRIVQMMIDGDKMNASGASRALCILSRASERSGQEILPLPQRSKMTGQVLICVRTEKDTRPRNAKSEREVQHTLEAHQRKTEIWVPGDSLIFVGKSCRENNHIYQPG